MGALTEEEGREGGREGGEGRGGGREGEGGKHLQEYRRGMKKKEEK